MDRLRTLSAAAWRKDIDALVAAVERTHINPWHGLSRSAFLDRAGALKADVAHLNPAGVLVGLMRLMADLSRHGRDGHTGMFPLQPAVSLNLYPLRLYSFDDGVFVVAATPEHAHLVGARIVSLGGVDVNELTQRIDSLIPRDNPMTPRHLAPIYLVIEEVLAGLGLETPARFVLDGAGEVGQGVGASQTVAAIPIGEYVGWAGGDPALLPERSGLRWLGRRREAFWLEMIGRGDLGTAGGGDATQDVLYIQYNAAQAASAVSGETIVEFAERVVLSARDARRVVVDIRLNRGGNNMTYGPLLDALAAVGRQPGDDRGRHRLYALIGRAVFSAGVNFITELERCAAPIFVGAPTGGSPNQYGDAAPVTLPNSKLIANISTRWWEKARPGDARLWHEPALPIPLTAAEYFAGRDPVLDAALAHSPPV